MPIAKVCRRCNQPFYVAPSQRKQTYCSITCRTPPTYKTCETCGKKFRIKPSRKRTAHYCSRECYTKAGRQGAPSGEKLARKIVICLQCNKSFRLIETSNQRFCSHSCAALYRDFGQATRVTRSVKPCNECNKPIKGRPKELEKRRFCSTACCNAHTRRQLAPTDIEQLLINELDKRNVPYEFQHQLSIWSIDFAFPSFRLAVEADGVYWHSLPAIQAKDARKDAWLSANGWTMLRFPGKAIRQSAHQCVNEIVKLLGSQDLAVLPPIQLDFLGF